MSTMDLDAALSEALHVMGLEPVRVRKTNTLRIFCRTEDASKLVQCTLLGSPGWTIDVSYNYFAEDGEVRCAWRLIIQPAGGRTLDAAAADFAGDVLAHFAPVEVGAPVAEVTEVQLLNTPANRNAPNGRGKGALTNKEVPAFITATARERKK